MDIAVREVDNVIFCGYSFPEAYIHFNYLLERAQTNRSKPLRFTVVNYHADKGASTANQEKYRYGRFVGSCVKYAALSFTHLCGQSDTGDWHADKRPTHAWKPSVRHH